MAIGIHVKYHGNTIELVDTYVIELLIKSALGNKVSRQEQRLPCRFGRSKEPSLLSMSSNEHD